MGIGITEASFEEQKPKWQGYKMGNKATSDGVVASR